MAEDQPLPVIAGGQPQPGNAWMAVVSDNADGFAVSSAAGLDGATGFQVTYQKLSLDGKTNGDTVPVSWEPPVSQVYPTIAAHGDDIFFAWTRSAVDEDDEVQHTSWRKKTAGFDPAPGVPALDSSVSGNAAYGGNPHGIFLAVTSQDSNPGSRIHVKPGDTFDPAVSGAMFGKAGQLNHTPAIAPHDGGGTVAWYEVIGGIKNKLHVQQFTYDGYGFTDSSDPITANDNPAAPYQPALTAIAKGVSFVAWSEGTSPNFTIMGRFVGLSPPNP
jgi:hypothetical protein